jgi:Rab-GTPase-TBC domain
MSGIGFEIQKDVDRTFIDSERFTPAHRNALSTVLRTFAAVDNEIGYVQGLNFIVGNFLLLFSREGSELALRRSERRVLASFLGLLKVLKIRDFYTEHMLGVKEAIFKLECILYNLLPEVYIYLL